MPENRQNLIITDSNPANGPLDNVEEGIRRMKIEKSNGDSDEKVGGEFSPPYPDRPGEPDCIYYLRTGLCGYGSKCRFNHPAHAAKNVQGRGDLPQRTGQPDCGFYLKTGTCKYGSSCKYHHPNHRGIAGQASLIGLSLPNRQETRPCPYYMRTYTCKFGTRCKFTHPQLSSAETTVLPVSSASGFGTMNSSVYPSAGMPYANGVSAWLLPRSPYLLGPTRVPAPQTYPPLVIPSSPGFMTAQGWSTYVGTVSPNFYGTNFYNTKDQEGLVTNGQYDSFSKISSFPERPDQPECRYFMSTGNCKYGSDCRYHHPKERIAQPSMNNIGPHGLPMRPGEAICSYFSIYGVCIYGPTCKFDHPFAGYVSSYGFNLQQSSQLGHDQPFLHFQGNSSINNYSESSPSKSSKISDWIPKPEPVDENEHPDANSPEDQKQSADDLPKEPATSSEVSHDH